MLQMGGPWYMTSPTLDNSRATMRGNVVWEGRFVVDMWGLTVLILAAGMTVGFAVVEMF